MTIRNLGKYVGSAILGLTGLVSPILPGCASQSGYHRVRGFDGVVRNVRQLPAEPVLSLGDVLRVENDALYERINNSRRIQGMPGEILGYPVTLREAVPDNINTPNIDEAVPAMTATAVWRDLPTFDSGSDDGCYKLILDEKGVKTRTFVINGSGGVRLAVISYLDKDDVVYSQETPVGRKALRDLRPLVKGAMDSITEKATEDLKN